MTTTVRVFHNNNPRDGMVFGFQPAPYQVGDTERPAHTVTEVFSYWLPNTTTWTSRTPRRQIHIISPEAIPVSAPDVIDCLVLLQQHQVDAISTSDILLAALAAQDPNTTFVGRPLKEQPYGVAIPESAPDLVRFVNSVLAEYRAGGAWTAAYTRWLSGIPGPPPAPPIARYES